MTQRLFHPSETITGSTFKGILPNVIKALERGPLADLDQAPALASKLKAINELTQRANQIPRTLTLAMQSLMEILIVSRQLLTDPFKLAEVIGDISGRLDRVYQYLYYHSSSSKKKKDESLTTQTYPFPTER